MAPLRRVFLIDDHPLVRLGLSDLIESIGGLEVCGEASGAEEALPLIDRARPHLVILDLSLPGASGLDLIKSLAQRHPSVPLLVLSMHDESLYAQRALAAGAKGYVMKTAGESALEEAIRRVLGGGISLSPSMTNRMLTRMARGAEATASPIELLSDRELEVFERIGQGHTTREIARLLHLSIKTVETYRANIKSKLAIDTTSRLAQQAVIWSERRSLNLAS